MVFPCFPQDGQKPLSRRSPFICLVLDIQRILGKQKTGRDGGIHPAPNLRFQPFPLQLFHPFVEVVTPHGHDDVVGISVELFEGEIGGIFRVDPL